jgi:NADH dehydrogenase FAD-containing subunit
VLPLVHSQHVQLSNVRLKPSRHLRLGLITTHIATRYVTRHKARKVEVIEGEALDIDVRSPLSCRLISNGTSLHQPIAKKVTITDPSPIVGTSSTTDISYDYLVYAVGAETQTFGIPGVKEHACFMKELGDAQKVFSPLRCLLYLTHLISSKTR